MCCDKRLYCWQHTQLVELQAEVLVLLQKILPLGVFNIRTTEQTLPTNFARPDTL